MGLPEEHFAVMQDIWRKPVPMHERNDEFEDYLRSHDFDPARLGPFTRLAFNMHGLVPPEEWLDIMPRTFHVHAKFFDIDENGDEPAMDVPADHPAVRARADTPATSPASGRGTRSPTSARPIRSLSCRPSTD